MFFDGREKIDALEKTVKELRDEVFSLRQSLIIARVLSGNIITEEYDGRITTIECKKSDAISLNMLLDAIGLEQVTETKEEKVILRKKRK